MIFVHIRSKGKLVETMVAKERIRTKGKPVATMVAKEQDGVVFVGISKCHKKLDTFSKKRGLDFALDRINKNVTFTIDPINYKLVKENFGFINYGYKRLQPIPLSLRKYFVRVFVPRISKYFKGKPIANVIPDSDGSQS